MHTCTHVHTCVVSASEKANGVLACDGRFTSKVERSKGLKEAVGSICAGGTEPRGAGGKEAVVLAHGLQKQE